MDLKYFQDCPTCGAPIGLIETDRLVQCSFCDVKNYMISKGPLRFVLPDKLPDSVLIEDVFYIPYLRFKGHIYSCKGREIEYKIVDTTHLGIGEKKLPATLGLRPQAMKLALAGGVQTGRFVKLTEKLTAIFSKATKLSLIRSDKLDPLYHRSFIGENISFIYLPTYEKDGWLFDAVLNRKITEYPSLAKLFEKSSPFKKEWRPRFVSTVCPHCAETMSGARDSLVLTCSNCDSCWQEEGGKFVRVDWSVVPAERENGLFLPFWRITTDAIGAKLQSLGDFLRTTNQPVVVRKVHERMELSLWVPAFKVRPKKFLHLAKNLTITQIALPPGKKELARDLYSVTMPLSEAVQALKTILAYSFMNKRKHFPLLQSIDFQTKKSELVYLPFSKVGHDFIQDHSSVSVSRALLNHGRTM